MKNNVKKFYSDDKLNKGYSTKKDKNIPSIIDLPSLDLLERYEEYYPGVTKKIMQLAEEEQKKKYALEKAIIAANQRSERLGAFFNLLVIVSICSATYKISETDINSALSFAAIAFGSIFAISLFSYLRKPTRSNFNVHSKEKRENRMDKKNDSQRKPSNNRNNNRRGNSSSRRRKF